MTMRNYWAVFCATLVLTAGTAFALPIVNGGFDADLSGWTATDGVSWENGAARLQIQPFEANVPVVTLSQAIFLSVPATLSFDVLFATGDPRELPPGVDPGQPHFFQATFLPDDPALDEVFLMGYDGAGPYGIDLTPLPGGMDEEGWYHFEGLLAAGSGILYLDLFDRGDGFSSYALIDAVALVEQPTAPIPEPSTLLLLGAGIAGLAVTRRRTV